MLIAPTPPTEEWKPVMGAEVLFAPIDRRMMRRARRAALAALGRPEGGGENSDDGRTASEQIEELGDELSHAILMEAIRDWRGVVVERQEGGETATAELPCTAENKALVLSDPVYFDAFDQAHFVPFVLKERAKNAPAGSPPGISTKATPAKVIARKPAPRARKAGRGAKPAPTANTRSTTTR